MYRNALKAAGVTASLFLAIPTLAYDRLFSKRLVLDVVREAQVKLIVVDVEREQIAEWLN